LQAQAAADGAAGAAGRFAAEAQGQADDEQAGAEQ
jgi:hypothetical protein